MEGAASVEFSLRDGILYIVDNARLLNSTHVSQLSFWGFCPMDDGYTSFSRKDDFSVVRKVVDYLGRTQIPTNCNGELVTRLTRYQNAEASLRLAQNAGAAFKDGIVDASDFARFQQDIASIVARPLKDHQLKAAYHLYKVADAANFSVPGSGKTSVVVSIFEMLRKRGDVNVLFVVGPPSCFAPWRTEYELTLGRMPRWEVLAGGHRAIRKSRYATTAADLADLYMTTYQSLLSDQSDIIRFLNQQGVAAFLVVDEAHYIKQVDGGWATAALQLARHAERRVVLTGTPIPRSYTDAFNLFDFLWPEVSPLSQDDKITIRTSQDNGHQEVAQRVLSTAIGPLFYRVRKSELGLLPATFNPPVVLEMHQRERLVYDAIENRIRSYAQQDYLKNVDFVRRLQRGRMIRLRQCLSNVALLATALEEYNEELVDETTLAKVVATYRQTEVPAKAAYLLGLIQGLVAEKQKVIVWTNFIGSLRFLHELLAAAGVPSKVIFGETPVDRLTVHDAETREQIIQEFKTKDLPVLILNPAACAESISLHTVCQHAIYYDLSYNLAQYLQSLDRIHRVGGSETKTAQYYFLQYARTIESDIYRNLQEKAERMYAIIEHDYEIYSLDMFDDDGDVGAYGRLFTHRQP